jgi:Beta-galactosidase
MASLKVVSRFIIDIFRGCVTALVIYSGTDLILPKRVIAQFVIPHPSNLSQLSVRHSSPIKKKISSPIKKKQRRSFKEPIATYWTSYPMIFDQNDARVKQVTDAGFNLLWGTERDLDLALKYKRRLMISSDLLRPEVLDDPIRLAKLNALIDRVKNHPAMCFYFIGDEPNAKSFSALGRLVSYIRTRDPAHWSYINLLSTFATYALGVKGEMRPAYQEYLRQFVEIVKPDFLSYDHYHFENTGDGDQYFLNLGLIRELSIRHNLPFINIVQASKWKPSSRVPNGNELRWLNYTSLAYGAQGISYYAYYFQQAFDEFGLDSGQMMRPDGTTTVQYAAAKELNPQFIAIAKELQPLNSLGAYHIGGNYKWTKILPRNAPFRLDSYDKSPLSSGMLLGYFGQYKTTHVLITNLNYTKEVKTKVTSSVRLEMFNPTRQIWQYIPSKIIILPPGGGILIRHKFMR